MCGFKYYDFVHVTIGIPNGNHVKDPDDTSFQILVPIVTLNLRNSLFDPKKYSFPRPKDNQAKTSVTLHVDMVEEAISSSPVLSHSMVTHKVGHASSTLKSIKQVIRIYAESSYDSKEGRSKTCVNNVLGVSTDPKLYTDLSALITKE